MELNRERIIRGLACCKGSYDCFTCDIYNRGCAGFREGLARDALALIEELTEENERLRAENVDCQLGFRLLEDAFERLEKINEQTEAETRADTVRQMQERLKERFSTATRYSKYSGAGVVMVIDQIAKEMSEGENES